MLSYSVRAAHCDLEAYLTTVKAWLDANPNEVLTLLMTNPDGLSLPDVWKPVFDASGITDFGRLYPLTEMGNAEN